MPDELPSSQRRSLRQFHDAVLIGFARSRGWTTGTASAERAMEAIVRILGYDAALSALKDYQELIATQGDLQGLAVKVAELSRTMDQIGAQKDEVAKLAPRVEQLHKARAWILTTGATVLAVLGFFQLKGCDWLNNLQTKVDTEVSNVQVIAEELRQQEKLLLQAQNQLLEQRHEVFQQTGDALRRYDSERDRLRQEAESQASKLTGQTVAAEQIRSERQTRRLVAVAMVELDSVMAVSTEYVPEPAAARKPIQLAKLLVHRELNEGGRDAPTSPTMESLERLINLVDDMVIVKNRVKLGRDTLIPALDRLERNAAASRTLRQDFVDYEKFVYSDQFRDGFGDRATGYCRYVLGTVKYEQYLLSGGTDVRLLDEARQHFDAGAEESASLRWLCLIASGVMSGNLAERDGIAVAERRRRYQEARQTWNRAEIYNKTDKHTARIDNNVAHVDYHEALLLTDIESSQRNVLLQSAWERINNVRQLDRELPEASSTWAEIYCRLLQFRVDPEMKLDRAAWEAIVNEIRKAGAKDIYRKRYPGQNLVDRIPAFKILLDAPRFGVYTAEGEKIKQEFAALTAPTRGTAAK